MLSNALGKLAFMEFGERLQTALELSHSTREALSRALGISVQAVGQVLVGKTKALTAENCARAARFLRVDSYWLATGEGQPRERSELDLTGTERDLVLAFRDIPEETQRELLADVLSLAERSRHHVDKILRERFGVTGYVSADKAAQHLPSPPPMNESGKQAEKLELPRHIGKLRPQ